MLDGAASEKMPVISGVPPGSVLGPASFLVYINDIVDLVETSTIRLFAVDTLIYRKIECYGYRICFQNDLNGLDEWSEQNSMC